MSTGSGKLSAGGLLGPELAAESSADAWREFSVRHPSLHRRHGDPFPLPRLPGGRRGDPPLTLTSQLHRRVDASLRSLNLLAAASFDTATSFLLPLTSVQRWMMEDIWRRVESYGECPADLTEAEAVQDLAQRSYLYSQEASPLVATDLDKIKILRRRLDPKDARDLAPPEARDYLEHFSELVERPGLELDLIRGDLNEPYWDPGLRRDKQKRILLYQALDKANLLDFRRRRKARVGFFTVRKKDGHQRLIIDARQANSCHQPPPVTRLATPAGITAVDLTRETLLSNGFGEALDMNGVTAEAGDVGDCFYNFCVPELASWFCTDDTFDDQELREYGFCVDHVYNDETGENEALEPGERVYAAFKGIPMGWSWALYLANEIVCHQVAETSSRDNPEMEEIRDRRPAPRVLPGCPITGTYVDNVHVIGGRPGEAGRRMALIARHFEDLGIPFEVDGVESQRQMDSLGLRLAFDERCTATAKPQRAWKLWLATRGLLRRRRVCGRLLRVYLGLTNFHFQLLRPAMAVFSASYKFAAQTGDRRSPIWPSVRGELRQALGLIFLVEHEMSAPFCKEVHIGDSSDRGYALMYTQASHRELQAALDHREKWRFIPQLNTNELALPKAPADEPSGFVGQMPGAGVGTRTSYGRNLSEKADHEYPTELFRRKRSRLLGPEEQSTATVIAGPSVPVLEEAWDNEQRWTLVTSAPWKNVAEHINIKEGRVLLMGLRRLARTTRHLGTTALSVTDNLVCCLAFEKGRSGSGPLNSLCRRAAAYQIAGRIQWRVRHIESKRNVSDGPSRRWGPDFDRPLRQPPLQRPSDPADIQGVTLHADSLELDTSASGTQIVDQGRPARYFLEIFSGTANLTQAVSRSALRVLPDVEKAKGRQFDLLNPRAQNFLLSLVKTGVLWCVHLGTPCTVWSQARHNIRNSGKARYKEAVGVALALFSARMIRACLRHHVFVSLENPQTSRLWQFGPIRDLFKIRGMFFLTLHMCAYNQPYKKPTSILTNMSWLRALQKRCDGGHAHQQLRGSESVIIDGICQTRNRTTGAGAYPESLCRLWAQLLRANAPRSAVGSCRPDDALSFLHGFEKAAGRPRLQLAAAPGRGVQASDDSEDSDLCDYTDAFLQESRQYLRTHPVVFGHFNAFDIAKLAGYNKERCGAQAARQAAHHS